MRDKVNRSRTPVKLRVRNAEFKRRSNGVGVFPHDAAVVGLVGTVVLMPDDAWRLNRCQMQPENELTHGSTAPTRMSAVAF